MTDNKNQLREDAIEFAIQISDLCDEIKGCSVYVNQIVRSSSSIGANIHEAKYAQSKADFINKLEISLKELKEVSGGKNIGKPHFAKVFLNKNYIQTKEEMFDKYFNKPPLSELRKASYTAQEIINMIKKANGIAVLAHPQNLKLEDKDLVEKIKELKSYGLDGMECYHSEQTKEEMIKFEKIANDLELVITKGTDYHGPMVKANIELANGIDNNLKIANDNIILDNLLKYKNE